MTTISARLCTITAFLILVTMMPGCSQSPVTDVADPVVEVTEAPDQNDDVDQPVVEAPEESDDATEPSLDANTAITNVEQPSDSGADTGAGDAQGSLVQEGVYYFIALHIDPVETAAEFLDSFDVLQAQVAVADAQGIRLTLMFTSSVAKFVVHDAKALLLVQSWADAGHEIAFHHHDVYHGSGWDGFTDLTPDEVRAIQFELGLNPLDFSYLGSLDDYISDVELMGFSVTAGCMNDEADKQALPDAITLDTCSGYVNYGVPGTAGDDGDAGKGVNEYVLTGTVNGIARRWLSHEILDTGGSAQAQTDYSGMTSGVFGGITHASSITNLTSLETFLKFLNSQDPDASQSRTLSQVIAEGLLPEKALP